MPYISHARTAEELRQELLSDLTRRINSLIAQRAVFGRGAAGKARFDGKIAVLEEMQHYWLALELAPKLTKKGTTHV